MADTVQITAGSGISVSTDELTIDGIPQHVQRFKLGLGANNAWDMDLDSGQQTMANSIPVAIASNQTSVPVTVGNLPVASGLTDNMTLPDTTVVGAALLAYGGGNWDRVGSYPTNSDGEPQSATAGCMQVNSHDRLYDGTSFNRAKSMAGITAEAGLGTGEGVKAAGLVGHYDDVSTGTVDEGRFAAVRISSRRALLVEGVASGTAISTTVSSIAAGDNNIGNVDIVTVPAPLSTTGGGTEATALRVTVATDSTGVLSVDDNAGSLTVDNAGTFAVQVDGSALTALQLLDNIVSGTGANISQINGVTPLMGNGTTGTGSLRVTVANDNTAIPTNISQMNGVAVTMGNGASGTGVQRVTIASDSTGQINTLGNIVDNAGFTDATTRLMMNGYIFDDVAGTALTENDAAAARVDSKRAQMFVMEDATTRGQKATVTTRGSQYVEGPTAHDSAVAGNPVGIGGYAANAEPAAVANADVVRFIADLTGKQIVLPYANPENLISGTTASGIVNTSDRQIIAAQSAGVRSYLTSVLVTNASASVGTVVRIKDGSTVVYTGYAAANGGGFSVSFPTALRLSAAAAVNAACVTTGADVWVSLTGYKGV